MPASGLNISEIKDALFDWAKAASGLDDQQIMWEMDEGTKPTKPFIGLNLIGPRKVMGRDYLSVPDPDALPKESSMLQGAREFTVSVNVYADPENNVDVNQLATDLQTSLEIQQLADALSDAGIGVGEVGEPIDLSELLETKWERRAQFDFKINVASNVDLDAAGFVTPIIETSPIKSTFN